MFGVVIILDIESDNFGVTVVAIAWMTELVRLWERSRKRSTKRVTGAQIAMV